MTMVFLRLMLGVAVALPLAPSPVLAQTAQSFPTSASLLCERAIASTERGVQIPPHLLGAIAQVESGRLDPTIGSVRPWPWTINADGHGYMFESKAEAIAAVASLRARGISSVDVGCMQINLMHHPTAFSTLDEAFDPAANIRYSARFLSDLREETGDWDTAVAFYHSRTPALGLEYRRKVALRSLHTASRTGLSNQQMALANAWAATRLGGEPADDMPSVTAWVAALQPANHQHLTPRTRVAVAQ